MALEQTMSNKKHFLAEKLALLSVRHPWWMLLTALIITIISLGLASGLEMRMNWSDTLPPDNPIVKSYREVQNRFGNPAGIVIALEGNYDQICAMADSLEPRLKQLDGLNNVQGRLPLEYFKEHGFVLLKPDEFDRMLRVFSDPSLVGTFRGFNDDYEREYTDSESNLKRDEVNIARSLLGTHRALEILAANLVPPRSAGGESKGGARNVTSPEIPSKTYPVKNAVDAFTLGEPYMLSLDRGMLLIACQPVASQLDFNELIAAVEEVEVVLQDIKPMFPEVSANLTGMGKIGQDEMNSVGIYTMFLSLVALLLIYILLAKSFKGWVLPIIALIPLIIGIFWMMGLLYVLFGSLNIFTAMIMIVLLGLGIDFSIHMISRFNEEIAIGKSTEDALTAMLSGTGVAVLTGGLTTAAAFLTLLIGETAGVFEFGAAAGFGVLLTLLAVFFVLPPLLVIRMRRQEKSTVSNETISATGASASEQLLILGEIAQSSYRHPFIYLGITAIIVVFSIWAKQHIAFEYDFLNLEPKGLKSVELQREIPKRFGMSDHAAWVVAGSIEESRELKEKFKKKPIVGDVSAISDFIPPADRVETYNSKLLEFRESIQRSSSGGTPNSIPPRFAGGEPIIIPPSSSGGTPNSIPPRFAGGEPIIIPPRSSGGTPDSIPPRFAGGEPIIIPPRSSGGTPNSIPPRFAGGEPIIIPPRSAGGESKGGAREAFDSDALLTEITRLWDNLDLMSNLAYTAGLDRIVSVIDGMTGTDSETGKVDKSAVLPTLTRILQSDIDEVNASKIAADWEARMRSNVYAMANPEPIDMNDVPETIKRSYLPREGDGYLVNVVPRKYLFSRVELDRFAEQTSSVSPNVAGTEQLIVVMFDSILSDGKKAALLALLVIILLVLIHFHGPIGLLSLVPLAAGALSMIGLMYIIGEKYNYMNLMAVPVILGIGIDDGIHALHRFRNEAGKGIDRIYNSYNSVGKAIFLTSATTMIGFGSIAFYTMEGMASFGRALMMGVGACFVATVLVLPAVLRLFTKSNQ
jgi:hypothetical protein